MDRTSHDALGSERGKPRPNSTGDGEITVRSFMERLLGLNQVNYQRMRVIIDEMRDDLAADIDKTTRRILRDEATRRTLAVVATAAREETDAPETPRRGSIPSPREQVGVPRRVPDTPADYGNPRLPIFSLHNLPNVANGHIRRYSITDLPIFNPNTPTPSALPNRRPQSANETGLHAPGAIRDRTSPPGERSPLPSSETTTSMSSNNQPEINERNKPPSKRTYSSPEGPGGRAAAETDVEREQRSEEDEADIEVENLAGDADQVLAAEMNVAEEGGSSGGDA